MNKIIGVIGSGTMGNGIAHVFAMCPEVKSVLLVDLNQDILKKAQFIIRKNLDRQVKKEIISSIEAEEYYKKISFTADIDGVLNQKILSIEEGAVLKIKTETYK